MKRTHSVLYAVVLKEHPGIVKLGRTTNWKQRRREYDNWNFSEGNGVLVCAVYCITEEYVDLAGLASACMNGMAVAAPIHRGREWFKSTIEHARLVIEDVLHTAQISFIEPSTSRVVTKLTRVLA